MRMKMIVLISVILCIAFSGCKNKDAAKTKDNGQPKFDIYIMDENNMDENGINRNADAINQKSKTSEIDDSETSSDTHNSANIDSTETANQTNNNTNSDTSEEHIFGTIIGIGDMTVSLNEAFTNTTLPDGKYIDENTMASFEDDKNQVIAFVQFKDSSTFTLRKTKNNGSDSEDSTASFADLKKGDLLDVHGYYENEIFTAINTIIYRNMDIR